jgi:hypothetical protein
MYEGLRTVMPHLLASPLVASESGNGFHTIEQVFGEYDHEITSHALVTVVHVGRLTRLAIEYTTERRMYVLKSIVCFATPGHIVAHVRNEQEWMSFDTLKGSVLVDCVPEFDVLNAINRVCEADPYPNERILLVFKVRTQNK